MKAGMTGGNVTTPEAPASGVMLQDETLSAAAGDLIVPLERSESDLQQIL
jgi:hypothetical protein